MNKRIVRHASYATMHLCLAIRAKRKLYVISHAMNAQIQLNKLVEAVALFAMDEKK